MSTFQCISPHYSYVTHSHSPSVVPLPTYTNLHSAYPDPEPEVGEIVELGVDLRCPMWTKRSPKHIFQNYQT